MCRATVAAAVAVAVAVVVVAINSNGDSISNKRSDSTYARAMQQEFE